MLITDKSGDRGTRTKKLFSSRSTSEAYFDEITHAVSLHGTDDNTGREVSVYLSPAEVKLIAEAYNSKKATA